MSLDLDRKAAESVLSPGGPVRDAKILRVIQTLKTINDKPAEEFWKDVKDQ